VGNELHDPENKTNKKRSKREVMCLASFSPLEGLVISVNSLTDSIGYELSSIPFHRLEN
jgi:hypothetical protein